MKQKEIEAAAIMVRLFLTGLALNFDANNLSIEVKIFRFQSPKSNLTSLPFAPVSFRYSRV